MYFVYVLRSEIDQDKTYVGYTINLKNRLDQHNKGESRYTNMFKPWKLETYISFSSERKAKEFEVYLKHGSGAAFLEKHLLSEGGIDSA